MDSSSKITRLFVMAKKIEIGEQLQRIFMLLEYFSQSTLLTMISAKCVPNYKQTLTSINSPPQMKLNLEKHPNNN